MELLTLSIGTMSNQAAVDFFAGNGLSKYAKRLVEETDAGTVDDLRLLDGVMVESLIQSLGIKLVSAEKLRRALRGLTLGTPSAPSKATSSPLTAPLMMGLPPVQTGQEKPLTTGEGEDSGETVLPPPGAPRLEECISICIDRSGSMGTPFAEKTINIVQGESRQPVLQRTRMEAVKAMFYGERRVDKRQVGGCHAIYPSALLHLPPLSAAFRDRLESVSHAGSHQLGLIQYDSEVEEMLGLTSHLDKFESVVDDVSAMGLEPSDPRTDALAAVIRTAAIQTLAS